MAILLKRAYDPPSRSDGARVLVDRLWPRGISKDTAKLAAWLRELAPSNELRIWFHAHPRQWTAFRKSYLKELCDPKAEASLQQLYDLVDAKKTVTLVYASRNLERNNATVLKELLDGMRKPPTSSGPAKAVASAAQRARARR